MDLKGFISRWMGKEIVVYCGSIKYRGVLSDVLDDGFLILTNVAVINPSGRETSEYESCVLNVGELSGIGVDERMGLGEDLEGEVQKWD